MLCFTRKVIHCSDFPRRAIVECNNGYSYRMSQLFSCRRRKEDCVLCRFQRTLFIVQQRFLKYQLGITSILIIGNCDN